MREQMLHSRHQEGGRLTGAGLRLARNILAGEGERQRLRLDGCAMREARVGEALENALVEIETVETNVGEMGF
jgi:hypothetical protein